MTSRRPAVWSPVLALSTTALKALAVLAPLAAGVVLLLLASGGG